MCGPAFNDAPSYRAAEAPIGQEVQREVLTGQAAIHPLLLARQRAEHELVALHRERAAKAGVVLDPASPISFAEHVLHLCDIVLVMTVNPGFGGQRFLPEMLPKISQLRHLCETRGLNPWIEVDGGQNGENVGEVVAAGADAIVAGSAIFKSPDYAAAISMLRRNALPVGQTP